MAEGKPSFSVQESVKTEDERIDLKVAGQDGSVVQFGRKRHTPLSKLMKVFTGCSLVPSRNGEGCIPTDQFLSLELPMPLLYAEQRGLSMSHIMFLFDGQPIKEADTPAQLEMEHEDTTEVYQQQTGGGC